MGIHLEEIVTSPVDEAEDEGEALLEVAVEVAPVRVDRRVAVALREHHLPTPSAPAGEWHGSQAGARVACCAETASTARVGWERGGGGGGGRKRGVER